MKDYDVNYELGSMTDTVYPVGGGMEDWAYASGWDYDQGATMFACTPESYTLEPEENAVSKEDQQNNRAVMFLVETSTNKIPKDETLGCRYEEVKTAKQHLSTLYFERMSYAIFGEKNCNGHIPRSMRVAWEIIK